MQTCGPPRVRANRTSRAASDSQGTPVQGLLPLRQRQLNRWGGSCLPCRPGTAACTAGADGRASFPRGQVERAAGERADRVAPTLIGAMAEAAPACGRAGSG